MVKEKSLVVVTLAFSGLSLGTLTIMPVTTDLPEPIACFLALSWLAIGLLSSNRHRTTVGITRIERSISTAPIGHFLFVAAILLPPWLIVVAAVLGSTSKHQVITWLDRTQRLLFMTSTSWVFRLMCPNLDLNVSPSSDLILPLLLSAMFHSALEGLLVALIFVLTDSSSPREIIKTVVGSIKRSLPESSLGAAATVVIVMNPIAIFLLLPLSHLLVERLRLENAARQGRKDSRTGLFNALGLDEFVSHEFERSNRIKNDVSMALFDLDYLRDVNNTYGHAVGDLAIVKIAEVLRNNCRSIDAVARIGGEEFVLLLPDTNIDEATEAAERIRRTIESRCIETSQGSLNITASVGVATRLRLETYSDLFDRADSALYESKHAGRNRVTRSSQPCSGSRLGDSYSEIPSTPVR